jgi:hypothetical protein
MAYAVALLFNAELSKAIGTCWRRLADAGLSRSMLDLGYEPHVTLAVYDTLDVDAAVASLDLIFSEVRPIDAKLSDVASFGAGSGVCCATLGPSPDLMRLHARTIGAIAGTCSSLSVRTLDAALHAGDRLVRCRADSRDGVFGAGLAFICRDVRASGAGSVHAGRHPEVLGGSSCSPGHPHALSR